MLLAGMNIARLNFSHGDFDSHGLVIEKLRAASSATGRRLAIMADLPGPKMRIGQFAEEPIELKQGDSFTLTIKEIIGDDKNVSVSYTNLPKTVKSGDTLYLNDGYIQLEVVDVHEEDVECKVVAGGELRSKKGLNLPNIDLGMSAFTKQDHECLKFAMEQGVDAVSQSFVEKASDIEEVRNAAEALGHNPFIIAKIERSNAESHLDAILRAADGVMIARGDLGVEIPIERIALAQKFIMQQANLLGKPVITATQLLESMTNNSRPTRAEVSDVTNAILDGTDCVMLSGESAMGMYPVTSVKMLTKISSAVEPNLRKFRVVDIMKENNKEEAQNLRDIIAQSVDTTSKNISPDFVFVPTRSGASARSISRFRLAEWIIGLSSQERTCQNLQFSYGVYPEKYSEHPDDWKSYIKDWMQSHDMEGDLAILTEGPSSKHPEANNRMEIIDLRK
jgi:pyruvate kinase